MPAIKGRNWLTAVAIRAGAVPVDEWIACVRMCSRDESVVELCNFIHGTNLRAPIFPLAEKDTPLPPQGSQASLDIALFISFVDLAYWDRELQTRHFWQWEQVAADLPVSQP